MTSLTSHIAKRTHPTSEQRDECGFTLIELLIVIVILGILSGIAIFAVSEFRSDATAACDAANERIDQTVSAAVSAGGTGAYTTAGGDGDCT